MKKKAISLLLSLALCLTLLPTAALAESTTECEGGDACTHEAAIGDTHYETLAEAIAAADYTTVTVLKDVTLSTTIFVENKVTLDLNGKTISADSSWERKNCTGKFAPTADLKNQTDTMFCVVSQAKLTVEDSSTTGSGTINAVVDGNNGPYSVIKMTDAVINTTRKNATLEVNGGTIIGKYYGITGEGTRSNTKITINGGKVQGTATNDNAAIYHPQGGQLTITGGELTGATGLYVKAGTINIEGGGINGVGEKKNYTFVDKSFVSTGDGVVVEACNYPGGNPVVSITGGAFTSKNNQAVAYYTKEGVTVSDDAKKIITGGEFTPSVADTLLKTGSYSVTFDPNGGTVKIKTVVVAVGSNDYIDLSRTIYTPTAPAANYTFNGWYDGETKVSGHYTPTANVTLKADWTVNNSGSNSGSSSGGGSSSSSSKHAVSVSSAKNGTVTVSPENASKGTTVTVTVKADKGYVLDSLTVLDKNGKKIELTDKGSGKYSFKMPDGKVSLKAVFAAETVVVNPFADVPTDAYYYDAVLWAAEKGITGGRTATTFDPYASCTRAQIVTFLWRAAGCPEPEGVSGLADVSSDAYYAKAVAWAMENGITNGFADGTFGVNTACTRAQAVAFLFRYAVSQGMDAVTLQELVSGYGDAAQVPGYALSAFNWALAGGIVQGNDGALMSGSTCTRAQIVTFLYRLLGE